MDSKTDDSADLQAALVADIETTLNDISVDRDTLTALNEMMEKFSQTNTFKQTIGISENIVLYGTSPADVIVKVAQFATSAMLCGYYAGAKLGVPLTKMPPDPSLKYWKN